MKIHFVGIGGIGVSALAGYYLEKGHAISGSDLSSSEITEYFSNKGVRIFLGKHKKENLPEGTELVIYSPAIGKENPEIASASQKNIKTMSYPQALGELTNNYFTIAISGAHGKSTTTAMISLILTRAGLDPTVIIGTKLKEFGGKNFRVGKSKYLIIEADEWNASFLNYWPKIIALTNIEEEHLDFYKDLKDILKKFREYIMHLPDNGLLIFNADDRNILKLKKKDEFFNFKEKRYSLNQEEAGILRKILSIPGEHNISNALSALTIARSLGISDEVSFSALSAYKGAWRRFDESEKKINGKNIILINDYGHHPTEFTATLQAARSKYKNKEIWCIFQPHQRQRVFHLFKKFTRAFSRAPVDRLLITDIYDVAGRETLDLIKKINSKKLVAKIKKKNVSYLALGDIKKFLENNIKGGEVIIIMGAGNIYDIASRSFN